MFTIVTSLYRSSEYLPGFLEKTEKLHKQLHFRGVTFEHIIITNDITKEEDEIFNKQTLTIRRIDVARETLYASWNRGIKLSTYPYITFWNVDDDRYVEAFEEAEVLLKKERKEIMYFPFVYKRYIVAGPINILVKKYVVHPALFDKERFQREMHLGPFFILHKNIFDTIALFREDLKITGDFEFNRRAAEIYSFTRMDSIAGSFNSYGKGLSTTSKEQIFKEINSYNEPSPSRSLITSCSNKFFPSVINLIGSIKKNYPAHPPIFVYDLGLFPSFRKELSKMDNVIVVSIPPFAPHYLSCYTWKTYIPQHPIAALNLYLDAGTQVQKPLDELFEKIQTNGYMFVDQGDEVINKDIISPELISKYEISEDVLKRKVITAGIMGFTNSNQNIEKLWDTLYTAGKEGDCLGFSKNEMWKSKGRNKTEIIRGCKIFRHDTTILSVLAPSIIHDIKVEDIKNFSPLITGRSQYIYNLRLNYKSLPYINTPLKETYNYLESLVYYFNRIYIYGFISLKRIRHYIPTLFLSGEETIQSIFNLKFMDDLHEYPSQTSNIRYYHFLKARVIRKFLNRSQNQNPILNVNLLDAGAGRGPYSYLASPLFDTVYCDEMNLNELSIARDRLKEKANILFENNNLISTKYPTNFFDAITCSEVLEHIEKRSAAVKELYRILKPNGRALISMPQKNSLFYMFARFKHRKILNKKEEQMTPDEWEFAQHFKFDSRDIKRLLKDGGFEILTTSGAATLPVGERTFSLLYNKAPFLLNIYIHLEFLLEKLFPSFSAFYFVEVKKA
ncbi:MAG: hypothetical protein JWN37_364 [Candidatus Nomurabacteria bacterium]|nr:hypothetical protein [Candidatus Nomurabacteria bacterium]